MLQGIDKSRVVARLKRVEGQIGALRRMIEEDQYCVDVLLQISAAQGALGKIGQLVLGAHVETCVAGAFEKGSKQDRRVAVDELMEVFGRYARIGK